VKRTGPPTQREAEVLADSKYVGGRLPENPDGTMIYSPTELPGGRWSIPILSRMERKPLPDMVLERDGKHWKVVRSKRAEQHEDVDPLALQAQKASLPPQDKQKESA
jgi:hypothetical protein